MKNHVLTFILVLFCYNTSLGQHTDLYLDKYESAFVDSRIAELDNLERPKKVETNGRFSGENYKSTFLVS